MGQNWSVSRAYMVLVALKNESTPSSAFYELPAWVGSTTKSQTTQCKQEKVSFKWG